MVADSQQIRAALWQQLETDRLFGLSSVPMRLPVPVPTVTPAVRPMAPVDRAAPSPQRPTPAAPRPASRAAADGSAEQRLRTLNESQVRNCRKCALCETRTQTVFGQGNPTPRLVFVGEAPGYEEDKKGLAFIGAAGELLTKMIEAGMGLKRADVFICNVLKCRPPNNRTPNADEILACNPYLREQLEILNPEVIVALGAPATKTLLNTAETIGKLRGRWHDYYLSGVTGQGPSIPCMPTYHPAYLLRTPEDKGKTWADLQMVMERLGLPIPKR